MKTSDFPGEHSHKLRSPLCPILDLSLWDKIAQKAEYAEHLAHFLALMDLDTSFARATRLGQAHELARRGFELADELAAQMMSYA